MSNLVPEGLKLEIEITMLILKVNDFIAEKVRTHKSRHVEDESCLMSLSFE